MALSKNQIKFIRSLHNKKYRQEEGLFFVEGEKIAAEIIEQDNFKIHSIYATSEWILKHEVNLQKNNFLVFECSENDLTKITALTTPNKVLMLIKMNLGAFYEPVDTCLLLDNVQDPGNLGTIIRIADWFGIENIYCSEYCAEYTNPKVLQASMGSFLRVKISYVDLKKIILKYKEIPCFGAVLNGEDIRHIKFPQKSFIIIGNEGRGISDELTALKFSKISIPKYGSAESLNAAIATGIICSYVKN
jgi:TrmH family RNA methyltransferase